MLTITLSAPLATSTSYTLQISYNITDLGGNPFAGNQIFFTTGTH